MFLSLISSTFIVIHVRLSLSSSSLSTSTCPSPMLSEIVLKCLYLGRIGGLHILWSVNKLARGVTKWTKACDRRVASLISYIHHTNVEWQICHVGNTVQRCSLVSFQDSDIAGDLEDSNSTSGGIFCIFGSHTFVSICWMCKKQMSVSHSSTESEVVSLTVSLRMDGIIALNPWDVLTDVFLSRKVLASVNRSREEINVPVSSSGGMLRTFGSRTFVSICWMCMKQTSVSHSSTESEIVSWKLVQGYGWKKFQWYSLFVHREKVLLLSVYVDDIYNWLERNRTPTRCGRYLCRTLIWENQHHCLTMSIWVAFREGYCG